MHRIISKNTVMISFAGVALAGMLLLHGSTAELRRENVSLREQVAQYAAAGESASNTPSLSPGVITETTLSEEEQRELLRLRGEVGVLRSQKREVEQRQPIRTAGSAKPLEQSATAGRQFADYLSKESLAFAGYDSPDAAVQSCFWAHTTLDGKAILEGFTPAQQEEWLKVHKTPEGVAAQIARCPVGANMDKVKGVRIINKQPVADDEVYYTVYVDGLGIGFKEKYKRIGSEWKFDGEYNVNWNP